jgi:transcriptional regulator with XRE-family HTH domain
MHELQPAFGIQLKLARRRLGLSQSDVAQELGIARPFYGRMERGESMPSVPTLRQLCLLLQVPADTLLDVRRTWVNHSMRALPPLVEGPPELRRLVDLLRTWPVKRLRLLRRALQTLKPVGEGRFVLPEGEASSGLIPWATGGPRGPPKGGK